MEKYNRLTILGHNPIQNGKSIEYVCECECGNVISCNIARLRDGHVKSCGCLQKEKAAQKCISEQTPSLVGQIFNRLTAVKEIRTENKYKQIAYLCLCQCGKETIATKSSLLTGRHQSCGCLNKELASKKCRLQSGDKHPFWKGGITPENKKIRSSHAYAAWRLSIFERDCFTCQKCNNHANHLQAHHLQSFHSNRALRLDINNGVTLCVDCHIHFHKVYSRCNNTAEQYNEWIGK